jgi:hypothetical protein
MVRNRVLASMCLATLLAGPASAQTNSGGGTRALAGETRPAELKGSMSGGRPILKPADVGIGTAVKPVLKQPGISSSTVGGGTVGGSMGGSPEIATGGRPPQPTTPCPGGKAWVFSDAFSGWYCL